MKTKKKVRHHIKNRCNGGRSTPENLLLIDERKEKMIQNFIFGAIGLGVFGVLAGLILYFFITKQEAGDDKIKDIASAIHDGAMAFLKKEYSYLSIFIIVVAGLLFLAPLAIGGVAFAYNPFDGACQSGVGSGTSSSSAVCSNKTTTDPVTGSDGIILKAANIIALVTGIAAVFIIIVSGLQFILSSGDPSKVTKAKDSILFAVIGLVVIVVARSIVVLVINRLH